MLEVLHSFPNNDDKFKEFIFLTFRSDEYRNTYVDDLSKSDDLKKFDIIILHSLRHEDCLFLMRNKLDVPVIWFFWGAEFLNDGKFFNAFLLAKTSRLRRKLVLGRGFILGFKQVIKENMPWLIDFSQANRYKLAALKKINYVVPVVPGDFDLLKSEYRLKPRLFHLNYVNPLVELDLLKNVNGRNILLGNSSSYTNNHLEAIDDLAKMNLEDRKVIIPLSYGDKILAEYVADYALDRLGKNKVIILREFMSFSDYNDLILSCEIVIMNHIRQQAVGNIVQSLLNGAHVYLRNESTVYQYLKVCGFKISSFNEITSVSALSYEDVLFNRNLAKHIFGAELQQKKLQSLIKQALGE